MFGSVALQTTLYVLAANIYPVQTRASGVGGAAGFGRLAAIAASMAVALVGLLVVRRHASSTRQSAAAAATPVEAQ